MAEDENLHKLADDQSEKNEKTSSDDENEEVEIDWLGDNEEDE
jgi:hypothetical protein